MATPTNLPATAVAGEILTAAYVNNLRGAFRILQVVSGATTGGLNSSSNTYIDSGLTATITPQSTSSLVLVVYSQNIFSTTATTGAGLRLLRGATTLDTVVDLCYGNASGTLGQHTLTFLDTPASTSAQVYKTQFNRNSGAGTITVQGNSNRSSMILFEISA
jgi:hypothetical protein